jgi:hypothetical protein
MGFSVNSTVSLGVKVKLVDFIDQIQESNIDQMKKVMENGFIEDENDVYSGIFMRMRMRHEKENWEEMKENLKRDVMSYDVYINHKVGKKIKTERKMLGELMYLIPEVEMMNMTQWGSEERVNGKSRSLDIDFEKVKEEIREKYAFLGDIEVVMMIRQSMD